MAEINRRDLPMMGILYGQYLFYLRTRDKQYLDYIQGWVDSHVNAEGVIDKKIDALDYMLPGNLLLILFKETRQQRYKTAAESIRKRLDTYPRTEDGGLWHRPRVSINFGSTGCSCQCRFSSATVRPSTRRNTPAMKQPISCSFTPATSTTLRLA